MESYYEYGFGFELKQYTILQHTWQWLTVRQQDIAWAYVD